MCSKVRTRPEPGEKVAAASRCPVCTADGISVFWEMRGLPVKCNVLCSTREEALAVPRGDIRLAVCHSCGFIYNTVFDASAMQYEAGYENALHFSSRFREYAENLAKRLVDKYDLRQKRILEIACGDGYFLRFLCELGNNRGIGFDPSYVEDPSKENTCSNVAIIPDYYGEQYAHRQADLVCCRHALEHVPDPVAFLRTIRRSIAKCRDTAVFFEVPNALFILRDLSVWDIIYEHCSYFSPPSLVQCFRAAGFHVVCVREEFEGQFLSVDATLADDACRQSAAETKGVAELVQITEKCARCFDQKLEHWRARLDAFRRAKRRVAVWGSGSKGVTFLNMMKGTVAADLVVDVNVRKEGRFVAGAGQEVVSPTFLLDYRPDIIIIMNPIYAQEIRDIVFSMNVPAEFLIA